MCGIFGYIGDKNAQDVITEGLRRLEYRGYDSWGVAVKTAMGIEVQKTTGKIADSDNIIEDLPHALVGIGHTRWATHGGVTQTNAHPHYSTDRSFVLAQNGIVENYQELKAMLMEKGYKFESQTDTEVIVRLVEEKMKIAKNLRDAVRAAFLDLHGRNTIIILEQEGEHIIAVRNGSPLVVGMGKEGEEFFIASDILSFANHTDQVVFLNDNEMAEVKDGELSLFKVKDDSKIDYEVQTVDPGEVEIDKEGYEHFMLKEIVEQKHTIMAATNYSVEELRPFAEELKKAGTIYTVGAGTAGFAAAQIAFYLRKIAGIKTIELKSYEMGSYKNVMEKGDIIIAVSQSGETADTIEALEYAKKKGLRVASIVNMVGSTTTRISDFPFFSRTGPEICVASTKAYTAQISWGYLLAMTAAGRFDEAKTDIEALSNTLSSYFSDELFEQIKALGDRMKEHQHFFVLGRDQNYVTALEGSLKVKEITYKHFEGFAAGELKHGVIALVDKGTPVFCITSDDEAKNDIVSAAAEVKARGAWTIGVGQVKSDFFDEFIEVPVDSKVGAIGNVVPFQLISYFLGVILGNNIDKPRNLAKSVTVK